MKKVNGRKIRSVDQYLELLKAAGRSAITLRNYRQVLKQYAAFLDVPLEQLHTRLDPDDLVKYAAAISDKREAGRKTTLITIHRYMAINGVEFDELEKNVMMIKVKQDRDDKPLTLDILQKMMDQGTPHSRAILSFLISTGCRAGETSKILLSDVGRIENGVFVPDIRGNVVNIRNEIAKRGNGGIVFLTSEAREYMTTWLKDRDRFIADADRRVAKLYSLPGGERHSHEPRKEKGKLVQRPENDQRLFAVSYSSLDKEFGRLYMAVDGERKSSGKGKKVTAHACRAFFRTYAAKTMGIDMAEGIMRHTGYLNSAYWRLPLEEKYRQFKEGEHALYITRADHRVQAGKLSDLERQNAELKARLDEIERIKKLSTEIEEKDPELFKAMLAAAQQLATQRALEGKK